MNGNRLLESLGLRPGQIAAAVGGGGKTSLLKALARECAEAGWRPAVLSTTTHIFTPEESEGMLLLGAATSVNAHLGAQSCHFPEIVTLARTRTGEASIPTGSGGAKMKLRGYEPDEIEYFRREGGILLVEADGSRGLPIKAPGPHEPVIPPGTDVVLGVIGLDALGMPIDDDHVFRPERLSEVTGAKAGEPITTDIIALLAAHPEGLFRGASSYARKFILLNKSDRIGSMEKLEEIGYIIADAACAPDGPSEAVLLTFVTQSGIRVVFRAS